MDWKLELIVVPVADVDRAYNTFLSFEDPDGNGWLVQEVRRAADD